VKRLLTLAFGLGAGALLGAAAVRRLDAARRAMAPTSLARQAGRTAGGAVERLRELRDETRREAAMVERDLRRRYGARDDVSG
jgi:hypothetical protein